MEIFCSSPWGPVEWVQAHGFDGHGVWAVSSGLASRRWPAWPWPIR